MQFKWFWQCKQYSYYGDFCVSDDDKYIADKLSIDYWTTIVIYKGEDEIYRSMGVTEKNQLYLAIDKILKNKI